MPGFMENVANIKEKGANALEALKNSVSTTEKLQDFVERYMGAGSPDDFGFDKLGKYVQQYYDGKIKGLKKFILDSYCNGGINIGKVASSLLFTEEEFEISSALYNFFVPLGLIMLIMYLIMDMQNQVTNRIRDFDMKSFFMIFFKGAIGLIGLKYGYYILRALTQVSNEITNYVINQEFGVSDGMDKFYATMLANVGGLSLLDLLGMALSAAVLQIANIIPEVLIMFQAISRKMETLFRVGIAPISLPDMYNGISNSKALVYIKKFASLLLSGPMMIVILQIMTRIEGAHAASLLNEMSSSAHFSGVPSLGLVLELALYGFAAAGLISSAKTIINDALGC